MLYMNRRNITAMSAALAAALLAPAAFAAGTAGSPTLDVGDPAPVLKPAKWIKDTPIPTFEKGHVYVVEFWATWCGPCKANIPHLTELAKTFKGRAEVIGVDIWESPDASINSMPKVEKFVKSQGDHMNYHVAADGNDNRVADAWMKAAGEGGIPASFIVGKDGKIAWIGNPALGIEPVLEQVLADKFDVAAARELRHKQVGPAQAINTALGAKDYAKALELTDAAIASNPSNGRAYEMFRFVALAHVDIPQFEKIARDTITQANGEISVYQMFCSIPASEKDLSPDVYKFGRTLVDEALQKKEREYLFYAMGAEMASQLGDKTGAVTSQTAAVKAAETDSHCPPEFLQMLRNSLEKFKTAAGA